MSLFNKGVIKGLIQAFLLSFMFCIGYISSIATTNEPEYKIIKEFFFPDSIKPIEPIMKIDIAYIPISLKGHSAGSIKKIVDVLPDPIIYLCYDFGAKKTL